ncbi:MAG: hypothetical protein KAS07_05480 [Candidatus Pacebacteria bacterium]|nr:hypothetical protein [Candidatus Paceibacterota bacterium]
MTFEKKIASLQNKPVGERKTIALVFTVAVFVVVLMSLYFLGAFSLSFSENDQVTSGSVDSPMEDPAEMFGGMEKELEAFFASTTDMIGMLQDIASSTTASTTEDESRIGTSTEESVAATSSDEIIKEDEEETMIAI